MTFELKEVEEGAEVSLTHENVSEEYYEKVNEGWKEHYWDKMKEYFEKEEK